MEGHMFQVTGYEYHSGLMCYVACLQASNDLGPPHTCLTCTQHVHNMHVHACTCDEVLAGGYMRLSTV